MFVPEELLFVILFFEGGILTSLSVVANVVVDSRRGNKDNYCPWYKTLATKCDIITLGSSIEWHTSASTRYGRDARKVFLKQIIKTPISLFLLW